MDFIENLPKSEGVSNVDSGGGPILQIRDLYSGKEGMCLAKEVTHCSWKCDKVLGSSINDRERSWSLIHRAILDGSIQDDGYGLELLHKFTSPNRWSNGAGQYTFEFGITWVQRRSIEHSYIVDSPTTCSESTRRNPFKIVIRQQP